jgi:hypothetical protein
MELDRYQVSNEKGYTLTCTQGLKYSEERIQSLKEAAALKHETFLDDCVDAFVMLAKNTSMTGMRVQVDAGLNVQGA